VYAKRDYTRKRRLKLFCQNPKVLIVDDEVPVCDLLSSSLSDQQYRCTIAFNAEEAVAKLGLEQFDVALLDIRLPGISGMELLKRLRSEHTDVIAIMITAVRDVDTAVEAMKLGAADYIVKPFSLDRVDACLRMLLKKKQYSRVTEDNKDLFPLVEDSEGMALYFQQMNAIAQGVEINLESLDGHSMTVTQRTVEIAHGLGILEKAIQRWASAREQLITQRQKRIESLQEKLEGSPLAQFFLGMTQLHVYEMDSDGQQN